MLLVNRTSCITVLLRFASHHLDVGDEDNKTPLMYAVMKNDNRNAAKMLLRAGADVRQKTKYDNTMFYFAIRKKEMLEILKHI